jgi:hypothetical protein
VGSPDGALRIARPGLPDCRSVGGRLCDGSDPADPQQLSRIIVGERGGFTTSFQTTVDRQTQMLESVFTFVTM